MGRRKKLFKIPFLKTRVTNKSFNSILGLIFLIGAILGVVSFFNPFPKEEIYGQFLDEIHNYFIKTNGILGFFLPYLLLLLSTLFFRSRKVKLVRLNVIIGAVLVYVSTLGISHSGFWGGFIFENLSNDFSGLGAISILTLTFFIGLILLLNTSIDAFILFAYNLGKASVHFVKNYMFRETLSQKKNGNKIKKVEEQKDKFIHEPASQQKLSSSASTKLTPSQLAQTTASQEFVVRPLRQSSSTWVYPPLSLLQDLTQQGADRGDVKWNAQTIERTLDSFGIRAKVSEVNNGPTVTQYALKITEGTKLSKITALGNDLALALAAPTGQIRIEAPIPGRSYVGMEIPNIRPELVTLKRLLESPNIKQNNDPLLVPLGLDVSGNPIASSIAKMPHVLIAGATNSGKSVMLNAWISTFLFRTKPEELRLIMVDPKRVELTQYNGVPHLMQEVIVEGEKIINALKWTVGEMEARYKEFSKVGARNLESFNSQPGVEKKPYIIFVIDELADLMMYAPGDAEDLITRIAQMARATGIHLVLATQRPSVDVITGLMKANIPTRIAFNVSSLVDSRVIIDTPGAEKLLGKGDMLFLPPDQAKPRRIQGPFITDKEVKELVNFLRTQVPEVHYTEEVTEQNNGVMGTVGAGGAGSSDNDSLFQQALEVIFQTNTAIYNITSIPVSNEVIITGGRGGGGGGGPTG